MIRKRREFGKIGRSRSAFTLIELLVVIALTTILLTVLFAPLIQAFQFTEQAQATAEAQDAARQTTEELTRELSSAAAVRDTTGNYLDLPLLNKSGDQIIAHAYNAYIDIVPPRPQQPAKFIDPTVDPNNPSVNLNPPAGPSGVTLELGEPGVGLPLSAGSTVVRYFVALRYPIDPHFPEGAQFNDPQPYTNRYDGLTVSSNDPPYSTSYTVKNNLNNTYQLYRANFQPYMQSGNTYVPNTHLFAVNSTTGALVYDDPDFFRIVTTSDPDLLTDPTGNTPFTTTLAAAHNLRVYNWFKIAKPVIATKEIDLVGLPRRGKNIIFDSLGNPVDAYETNANGTRTIPIVRTTINFAPGLVSNDPLSASNNADISQGYGESPDQSTDGLLPYVPTLFQSQYGNWQGIPAITITKTGSNYTNGLDYEQTRTFSAADAAVSPAYTLGTPDYSTSGLTQPAEGDLILADVTNGAPGTPVYDITQGAPIDATANTNPTTYDALLLDMNRGEVTFALPALPKQGTPTPNPPNTYFTVSSPFNQYATGVNANVINLGDYNLLPNTPLSAPATEITNGNGVPSAVPNAVLVVNSERVVGPDLAPGVLTTTAPTDYVQYTRVTETPQAPDEYCVDYQNNTITFDPSAVPTSVQIAFSYQNNLNAANGTSADTVDTLRASYYTAAIMRLNLGVRVYGASTGNSQYFSLNSQVGVGNAKAN